MSEVLARGPNFVYAAEYLRNRFGEDKWKETLAALPPAAARVWGEPMLVTNVYPFQTFKDLLVSLEQVVHAIPEQETTRMYEHIADRSLTTVHKFFLRFADPSFVIKRYPLLWQRFFLAGKVEVPTAGKGHASLEFELPEIFLDWLRPACTGYSKRAVELAGGSDFRLIEAGNEALGDGSYRMAYRLSWKE
jgi:hypothetical protein